MPVRPDRTVARTGTGLPGGNDVRHIGTLRFLGSAETLDRENPTPK